MFFLGHESQIFHNTHLDKRHNDREVYDKMAKLQLDEGSALGQMLYPQQPAAVDVSQSMLLHSCFIDT